MATPEVTINAIHQDNVHMESESPTTKSSSVPNSCPADILNENQIQSEKSACDMLFDDTVDPAQSNCRVTAETVSSLMNKSYMSSVFRGLLRYTTLIGRQRSRDHAH